MAQKDTFDLKTNTGGGVSIVPGAVYTPTTDVTGGYVDCTMLEGPIQADCAVGAATGSPTAISVEFHLEEADDAAGTNNQEVASQTVAVLVAASTNAILTAQTTKPFVRVVLDDSGSSLTGGSSPTIPCGVSVIAQKKYPG